MFSDNLVACIKVGGKILREDCGTVTLPFGSEYSILIKNLNSVHMQVSVSVDGSEATGGTRLIVPANGSIELERFIRDGNLQSGNRFKFIERSEEIEAHRGARADDGIVRVEGWREADRFRPRPVRTLKPVKPSTPVEPWFPYSPWFPYHGPYYYPYGGTYTLSSHGTGKSAMHATCSAVADARSSGDAGITVPGNVSNQEFFSSRRFSVESHSTVVSLRLQGIVAGAAVVDAVTTDHKAECSSCGKKGSDKFCSRCGTALVLI